MNDNEHIGTDQKGFQRVATDADGFQLHVVDSLARLETLAESTDAHLKRVNGTIARHEDRLVDLTEAVTKHPLECPMRAQLESLRLVVVTDKAATIAAAKITAAWWKRLSPAIWASIGAFAILLLLHAKDLIPFLQEHLR